MVKGPIGHRIHLCLAALVAASPLLAASPADLAQARQFYELTDYESSLRILQSIQPKDGPVLELIGRNHYMQAEYKKATEILEKAVSADPANAEYELWLGRAFGRRAETASPFTAPSNAGKARQHFEKAVQLDSRNMDALSDLFEYYLEAPGFMGGGLDKAESIASRLDRINPARAHELRAAIAESRNDDGTAEHELKLAIETSPHPAFQWSVLASFYEHRKRWPEMEDAINNCASSAATDRTAGVALYDGAGVLIRARRDPELAAKMLQDYLGGNSKTEEAPAFVAHYRLARLLNQLGDRNGAQREQAAGYALASEYRPPQDAKH